MKQTPLKRSQPLRSGGQVALKRTPLNPVSPQQAERKKIWRNVRFNKALEVDCHCEICGEYVGFNGIGHHILRRDYHDDSIENCLYTCVPCHDRIDSDPEWAIENGYKTRGY